MRDHTGQKQCRKCDNSFSVSGDLKKHKKTYWWSFMRGLTWKRKHSSAPNVTIASLHQMNEWNNNKMTPTGRETMDAQSLPWASQDQVNGRKMGKPHKRETFFCSKCAKRFSGSGDLEKHERTHNFHERRTHTGEKAFNCTKCDDSFSSSNHWKNY